MDFISFIFGLITTVFMLTPSQWSVGESLPIPELSSSVKLYTDYKCYNIDGTAQKDMQSIANTDELGFRKLNGDYIVAMGTFYSEQVGNRFLITLENGNQFTVITGDIKADIHTDSKNMYTPCLNYKEENCANVIEFIIDERVMDDDALSYGSMEWYEEFEGDIVSITYLGCDMRYI